MKKPVPENARPQTRLVTAAREFTEHGAVNPAIYRASTITFPDAETMYGGKQEYIYGRRGTPTSRAFESAIAALEGGHACKAAPSGLMAITVALLAFLNAGDHLLMVDTVYTPARKMCDNVLAKMGVQIDYYSPGEIDALEQFVKPNTRVIYCEAPGSQTMEMQDIAELSKFAHDHHAICMMDNTWSAGYYFKAFAHGVDVSIQAATKYIVGHSDVMLGTVTCNEKCWPKFKEQAEFMGICASPDDMYLALRGLRTLDVRLERHMHNGLKVANWLCDQSEVEAVLHPALPSDPGHELWKRQFDGATGLFSIALKPVTQSSLEAMLNALSIFAMGASWGGYESLILPFTPERKRGNWKYIGPGLRLHIGLENVDDLVADLSLGIAQLHA